MLVLFGGSQGCAKYAGVAWCVEGHRTAGLDVVAYLVERESHQDLGQGQLERRTGASPPS